MSANGRDAVAREKRLAEQIGNMKLEISRRTNMEALVGSVSTKMDERHWPSRHRGRRGPGCWHAGAASRTRLTGAAPAAYVANGWSTNGPPRLRTHDSAIGREHA